MRTSRPTRGSTIWPESTRVHEIRMLGRVPPHERFERDVQHPDRAGGEQRVRDKLEETIVLDLQRRSSAGR